MFIGRESIVGGRLKEEQTMQVKMTQAEFEAATARLKSQHGIELSGPEGTIEKMGVKASYLFDGEALTIQVLEKPFIVSKEYVEDTLKEWLG
jgi:hypothetical protein